MRMLIAVIGAALLAPLAFPQEAQIMIVEKPDSQRLAKAYREYKEAQKAWEVVKDSVSKTYTREGANKVKEGWDRVQFSADFRAIVPMTSQYAYRSPGCWSGFNTIGTSLTTSNTALVTGTGGSDTNTIDGDLVVNGALTVKEKPTMGDSVYWGYRGPDLDVTVKAREPMVESHK